jgi:hypothetical protein
MTEYLAELTLDMAGPKFDIFVETFFSEFEQNLIHNNITQNTTKVSQVKFIFQ